MKVEVYGKKVVEVDDTFKILKRDDIRIEEEMDLDESLQRAIKDKLGYNFEVLKVCAEDDNIVLYEFW